MMIFDEMKGELPHYQGNRHHANDAKPIP